MTAILVEDYVQGLRNQGVTDPYALLTNQEKEVFRLRAEGRVNKEVAAALDLLTDSVESHRAGLGGSSIDNGAEIVLYAMRRGLIA